MGAQPSSGGIAKCLIEKGFIAEAAASEGVCSVCCGHGLENAKQVLAVRPNAANGNFFNNTVTRTLYNRVLVLRRPAGPDLRHGAEKFVWNFAGFRVGCCNWR